MSDIEDDDFEDPSEDGSDAEFGFELPSDGEDSEFADEWEDDSEDASDDIQQIQTDAERADLLRSSCAR